MSVLSRVASKNFSSHLPAIFLAVAALGCAFIFVARNHPSQVASEPEPTPSTAQASSTPAFNAQLMAQQMINMPAYAQTVMALSVARRNPAETPNLVKRGLLSKSALNTALLECSISGIPNQVLELIANGANVNCLQALPNNVSKMYGIFGKVSPLMLAASRGRPDLVSILITHGAFAFMKDEKGQTAGDYARRAHQVACEQIIGTMGQHMGHFPGGKPTPVVMR